VRLRRSAQSRPASDEGLGVMIEVDGAHGEGGGQLLRMAVALSALTDTPVRVVRIRAGRPTPGLAAQHVTAIDAVAKLCGGEVAVEVLRRGYYPRGGGIVEVAIAPTRSWSSFVPSEGVDIQRVRGIAHASNLPEDVPKRMKHAALRRLHGISDVKVEERVYRG